MAGLGLYLRISVDLPDHPKFIQAGPAAAWFWQAGLGYSKKHKTDGFIPAAKLATLVPGVNERESRKLAAKLVDVRLWLADDGGYRVKDYLDYNPSRAELESDAQRKRNDYRRRRGDIAGDTGGDTTGESGGERFGESNGEKSGEASGDARVRDRAIGSGSDSGHGSGLSSSEGGAGETALNQPVARRHVQGAGAFEPGSLPRDHVRHSFCGARFCVTVDNFAKLKRQYGGQTDTESFDAVEGWLKSIDAGLGADQAAPNWFWIADEFTAHLVSIGRLRRPTTQREAAKHAQSSNRARSDEEWARS